MGVPTRREPKALVRERNKSWMLRAWILSGLFFMALPGTLLGFSNLMAISAHHGLGVDAGGVDGRAWTRTDVRVDRELHSRHRVLFAAMRRSGIRCSDCVFRFVDRGRASALEWEISTSGTGVRC